MNGWRGVRRQRQRGGHGRQASAPGGGDHDGPDIHGAAGNRKKCRTWPPSAPEHERSGSAIAPAPGRDMLNLKLNIQGPCPSCGVPRVGFTDF
ncbi:hypothetical protein BOO71_0013987 [Deinococcus marmoris]|uniref:Uncharacterized protein n=1 Tax=Deinococcus marmoris TaxID=249408 RepID=A0A1U7NS91_9DEIO|nr:hypothetical protein BOO71_0013987 [Deinococcus marmoris]